MDFPPSLVAEAVQRLRAGYRPMSAQLRNFVRNASPRDYARFSRLVDRGGVPMPDYRANLSHPGFNASARVIQRAFRNWRSRRLDRAFGGPRLYRRVKALNRRNRFLMRN
ncbi:calmodulin [Genomoviridae sp.]|nr:calmodulin [Genomoviridae sp.]